MINNSEQRGFEIESVADSPIWKKKDEIVTLCEDSMIQFITRNRR